MFYPIKLYFKDKWVAISFAFSAGFFVYVLLHTLLKIRPTTEQLYLHYNIIFGVDLIGEWWKLYAIPALSFLVTTINFVLSYFFYRGNRFLARFLAVITALLGLLLLIATNLIVGLNS